MEWISVKDKMPADDVMVLIVCSAKYWEWVMIGYHDDDCWRDDYDVSILAEVTHWMTTPEPPAS